MRAMTMLVIGLPAAISIATVALAQQQPTQQQQTSPRRAPATTQQRHTPPAAPAPAPTPATRSVTPNPNPSQTTTQLQTPFSQGQTGPITVDADHLEIRDKEKKAIFTGNVVATRGDSTVRSSVMVVFYAGDVAGTQTPAPPTQPAAPASQQQVRRIEMTGKVLLNQRDQTVTGDNGVYEHEGERETLTVTGNVVVTKGQDVIKGTKLVVDLHTNQAQVDSGPGERVRAILVPNEAQTPAPGAPGATSSTAPPRATPPTRPRN